VRRRPPHLTRAWWNTPRLVRALTALVLTAVPAFAATTATVLTGARDGPDTIGHRSGPQAVRATDLSFALDDMDARAANLLLLGADPDHATLRRQTLETYEQRRAYDSVIALTRARAVAYDMNADESRYLTDPARAAAYERSFLDKSQTLARLGATLATYDDRPAKAAERHRADRTQVPFAGYLGTELGNITFGGEQDAAEHVLTAYQQYQRDDRAMRALLHQGRLKDAVTFTTGLAADQSNTDFAGLAAALAINRHAFEQAVADIDADLGATTATTGALGFAAELALTVLGVRPRLREFR
jgi:hypothetical protein